MQAENYASGEYVSAVCREMNNLHQWGLPESDLAEFVESVLPYIQRYSTCPETTKRTIQYYFKYRDTVTALLDPGSPEFERDAATSEWHVYLTKVVGSIWSRRGPIAGFEREDVVQLVWERLLKGLKGFRFQSKLETWVFEIAANTDVYLRRLRIPAPVEEDFRNFYVVNDSQEIAAPLIAKEEQQELRQAVVKCLQLIAQTKKRLAHWIECYPDKLEGLAGKVIQVLVGDLKQHELARNYLHMSEPTISRIINELQKLLPEKLRERARPVQTSNISGNEV